jgi:hypothetical protein
MVVLLGAVAFTIDIGRLRHERGVLQNAVDFGALAGAGMMPVQGAAQATAAENIARQVALANAPGLASAGLSIGYRCVVSDPEGNGGADAPDLGMTCGPATGIWSTGWTSKRNRAIHPCEPRLGDLCNTIVLTTSRTVPYYFAPALGINEGSTGAVNAASCKGSCGTASAPLDVVMVLDRTGSMTTADIQNLRDGAKAVLDAYDSRDVWVGMVSLPYGRPTNRCVVNDPQLYPTTLTPSAWWVVPVQGGYDGPGGVLNAGSPIAQAITCMQRSPTVTVRVNGVDRTSAGHTNLGDPLDAARAMLASSGRSSVPDVIIFETDGQANQPDGLNPCTYLNQKAIAAKSAGVTIYTIAYGLDNPPVRCTDRSGSFINSYATTNIASVATTSTDDLPGGCAISENQDGDNYFCTPGSTDLTPVFTAVTSATLRNSRLIDV